MLLQIFVYKLLCEHVSLLLEIYLGAELLSMSVFCSKKYRYISLILSGGCRSIFCVAIISSIYFINILSYLLSVC